MKYVYYLLATLILALLSCSNRKHPSEYYPRSSSSYDPYTEPVKHDSAKYESTVPKSTESYSSSGRSRHEDKELDNMRGFDPASEDDMDDNGMQRYFDANDDEAWD
jgi:hypothetical protein